MNRLKLGAKIAGCALLWLAAALSVCVEFLCIWGILALVQEVVIFGQEQNPYVVKDVWTLGVFALFNLLPLLLFLIPALYCTSKLRRKKGTPCTPNT